MKVYLRFEDAQELPREITAGRTVKTHHPFPELGKFMSE
jgi:hypothetical protein